MSDTQEKSDDLIAELAKLMASNAQGSEGGPKPTVIKLPPLSEATIQTAPVRIPGMEPPKPATAALDARPASVSSSAPAIRIPGMERPTGIAEPAPASKPSQIDMGKPLGAPAIAPEPLANWQSREVPQPTPVPARPATPSEMKFEPARPAVTPPPMPPAEPVIAPPAPPPQATSERSSGDSFNFDFGFGGGSAGEEKSDSANDPIADLIAAELDAPDKPAPDASPVPAPVPARAVQVQPQPVVPKPVAPVAQRTPAAVSIKPVSVTPRPAEADRFAVAPVFGFNSKAASAAPPAQQPVPAPVMTTRPAPKGDFDPMDEIEDLIGEAVRGGGGNTPEREKTAAPAPVVPPLNTGFAPRRAGIKDNDAGVQSAEAAILAAAASSGVEVGRVDTPSGEDRAYKRMKVKPPKTSFLSSGARQYVGIAVAGTLLLASGFGLYWVLGMNRGGGDAAPVLTADADPTKVEPVAVASTTAEPARSVVFDEIEGTKTAEADETLVSRDETAGVQVADVARVVTPPAEEEGLGGLANRRVRTVTVRPDGTIVSGDEAVAGAAELPVDRPNVPEIQGADIEPSDLLTAVAENNGAAPQATASAGTDPIAALVAETGAATTSPLAEPAPLEVAVADTNDVLPVFDASIVAPDPAPRPTFRGGTGPQPQELLTVEEAAAIEPARTPLVALAQPAASAPVDPASAGAFVQVASVLSQADAEAQVRTQTSRYGTLFGGNQLVVQRADLADKGVRFRVRLPVDSLQDATRICASIKANGGDCFATNG